MLELKSVSKKYSNQKDYVLKNINLKFDSYGFVSILGRSGSGKSTLLNIMGLLDNEYEGSLIVNGVNLNKIKQRTIDSMHQTTIGFIFQHYHLLNNNTVEENVLINSSNPNIDEILANVGLLEYKNTKVSKLSGGEKQRVAIARSLINNPSILLCDEPTGALDTYNAHKIMELLKEISKTRLVIVVTHNEEEASMYANRILRINDGEIISDDSYFNGKKEIRLEQNYKGISLKKMISLVKTNIKSKRLRVLLTTFAFSIGISSLLLVLSISSGFNASIEEEEKTSLSMQPIYISSSSIDVDKEFSKITNNEEKTINNQLIGVLDSSINIINEDYLNYLSQYKNNRFHIYSYLNEQYLFYGTTNASIYDDLILLKGSKPILPTDAIIIVNNSKVVNKNILSSLNISKNIVDYEEIINKKIKICNQEYTISGIYEVQEDNSLSLINGLLINQELPIIPEEIYLFPRSYTQKQELKAYLNNEEYANISYTDYASTLKTVSKTLMDGISIIMTIFSFISLFVCAITIGIITYISVIERTKEIGILKSVGINYLKIKSIFYFENIFISFSSTYFAYILTDIISYILNELISYFIGLENVVIISPNNIILVALISLFIIIFSSLLPLRKIKKINIIETLTYE